MTGLYGNVRFAMVFVGAMVGNGGIINASAVRTPHIAGCTARLAWASATILARRAHLAHDALPHSSQPCCPEPSPKRPCHSKSNRVVLRVEDVDVTHGGAQTGRQVVVGPATHHPMTAITTCGPRRTIRRRTLVGTMIAVRHPFGCIAMHVIEPKSIRLKLSDGRERRIAVIAVDI